MKQQAEEEGEDGEPGAELAMPLVAKGVWLAKLFRYVYELPQPMELVWS